MAHSETTVINYLTSLLGSATEFQADWKIPVKREGWDADVHVSIGGWDGRKKEMLIHVSAYATLKRHPDKGFWHHTTIRGRIHPRYITRQWIDTVLTERIETARLAALAVSECDLQDHFAEPFEGMSEDEIREHFDTMRTYFLSTFGLPSTSRVTG